MCTTFDPFRLNQPDFSEGAIRQLDRDFAEGDVAVEIWKNIWNGDQTARRLEPEEIVPLAVLLASDESAAITGQAFNICGGAAMF